MIKRYYIDPKQAKYLKDMIKANLAVDFVTWEDMLYNVYLKDGDDIVISAKTGLVTIYSY